jgi:hypothetical protein
MVGLAESHDGSFAEPFSEVAQGFFEAVFAGGVCRRFRLVSFCHGVISFGYEASRHFSD